MPGRCGSSPWTSEIALRKRLAASLPRVRGRSYWIPGSYALALSEKGDLFLSLLKNKGFREESITQVGLYAIGTSMTLESNKSPCDTLSDHIECRPYGYWARGVWTSRKVGSPEVTTSTTVGRPDVTACPMASRRSVARSTRMPSHPIARPIAAWS